ncbi:GyrI-like domain-containing protein [Paenibacillus sp. CF384]|uniref:GyrI-like domain-containing protein n=1 Tax=Paenibacillus sp. CF384 TaxID=1884382 RepID=UPI00089BD947|nr:GyrI-like domain-containing protein [Paenibacillus sp. CF384]SDW12265.1 GyrI-like small molecule binding domain-containing protein [Paenibacillus sp. CF384]
MTRHVVIVKEPTNFSLYGFSKVHKEGTPYSHDVRELMDKLWSVIQKLKLPHLGINHVVYEQGGRVFAGVELEQKASEIHHGLESLTVTLHEHAYYKHVGPYDRLGEAYDAIHAELQALGKIASRPLVELYGHWSDDPAKLETDIYMKIL